MYLKLRVGELMRQQGISEKDMHDRTGLARNTVRALMRGAVARVDLDTLERVAAVLNVPPLQLFEEVSEKPGPFVPALATA